MNKSWSDGTYMEKSMRTRQIDSCKYIVKDNKKEKYNQLINKRELIPTNLINPHINSNNYIKDLSVQSKFLIPQNSQY